MYITKHNERILKMKAVKTTWVIIKFFIFMLAILCGSTWALISLMK